MVVLIKFLWGRRSDDRGTDSIPPTPLIVHDYESEILLMQKEIVLHKSLQLRFLLALSPKLLVHQLQIQIKSLFNVSRISNTFNPKRINHLGDKI